MKRKYTYEPRPGDKVLCRQNIIGIVEGVRDGTKSKPGKTWFGRNVNGRPWQSRDPRPVPKDILQKYLWSR